MYTCRHTHTGVPTRKHEYTYGRIQNNLHKQYVINSVIVLKHIIFGITNVIKDFRNSKFKMFHLVLKKFIMDQTAPESRCKLQTYPLGVFTEALLIHCLHLTSGHSQHGAVPIQSHARATHPVKTWTPCLKREGVWENFTMRVLSP